MKHSTRLLHQSIPNLSPFQPNYHQGKSETILVRIKEVRFEFQDENFGIRESKRKACSELSDDPQIKLLRSN
jgi:hypothetical protein